MNQPRHESQSQSQREVTETKDELIERLLAKAELDHKCCGTHCSNATCDGGGVKDGD